VTGREITPWAWEMYTSWYDPARHYANFIVIDLVRNDLGPEAEPFFGKPASTHRVGGWEILVYHRNLLEQLKPPEIGDAS
jgi:hypothetical protein